MTAAAWLPPPNEHYFSSNTISICDFLFLYELNPTFLSTFFCFILCLQLSLMLFLMHFHFYHCTPLCCMNMSQFIDALYCWMLLYCLLFGMIMTIASMNISESIILNTYIHISSGFITISGTPGSYSS